MNTICLAWGNLIWGKEILRIITLMLSSMGSWAWNNSWICVFLCKTEKIMHIEISFILINFFCKTYIERLCYLGFCSHYCYITFKKNTDFKWLITFRGSKRVAWNILLHFLNEINQIKNNSFIYNYMFNLVARKKKEWTLPLMHSETFTFML